MHNKPVNCHLNVQLASQPVTIMLHLSRTCWDQGLFEDMSEFNLRRVISWTVCFCQRAIRNVSQDCQVSMQAKSLKAGSSPLTFIPALCIQVQVRVQVQVTQGWLVTSDFYSSSLYPCPSPSPSPSPSHSRLTCHLWLLLQLSVSKHTQMWWLWWNFQS